MCPVCQCVSPVVDPKTKKDVRNGASAGNGDPPLRCGNPACGAEVRACRHRVDRSWCNRWVDRNEPAVSTDGNLAPLCVDCRLTTHLPDLSNTAAAAGVQRMEFAKQRTLYTLRDIGLPIDGPGDPLPLTFRFLEDAAAPVQTGHEDGVITINLREADPVQREAARVRFGEPQRTLVGHLRHELGHYYWQRFVQNDAKRLASFRQTFGDETNPDYAVAISNYYSGGPKQKWTADYVSAYATMHPWEDFAETFNAYLDMRTVLSTTEHFDIRPDVDAGGKPDGDESEFDRMIRRYMVTGLVGNELNRDLGLPDLVPEVFTPPVRTKLAWIDTLVREVAKPRRLPKQTPSPNPDTSKIA